MHNISEYKELYHYDDKRSLVMNEVTGDVRMMKRLTHFDEGVYAYLFENKNPHIPQIYEYWKDGDVLIVIEEVVQGNTFDITMNDKDISDREKLSLFLQMLEGLIFLHSAPQPIIHRDLKPSNIMVTDKGEVKILDYDAAKIYKPDSTGDTTHLGTEGVAAPEQYGFMQSDPRSDVYAAGKILAAAFPNNQRIQKIAEKASSFDPKDRYENAGELSDALEGKISPNLKLKPLFPPPGFRTRKWWKITLALLFYPLVFFLIIGMNFDTAKLVDDLILKIYMSLTFLAGIDICNSWTGIFDILPFINHKNIFLRYFFKLIFVALAAVVLLVMTIFLDGIIHQFI